MTDWLFPLETELQSFMEVLLKAIVYEVSDVFRGKMSDSEDAFRARLHRISQILARRAVFKIIKFVEGTFGTEMLLMKQEVDTLRSKLQFCETGGDRGRIEGSPRMYLGYTPPCEATGEIKEEIHVKWELAGTEGGALPDAGDGPPLEQQRSEEEEEEEGWGSRLMQETELPSSEGKETLGEQQQQQAESRPRLGGLGSAPAVKPEPESEPPDLQRDWERPGPPRGWGGPGAVSPRAPKTEEEPGGAGDPSDRDADPPPGPGREQQKRPPPGGGGPAPRPCFVKVERLPPPPPAAPPPPPRQKLPCAQCGLLLSRPSSLKRHQLLHAGQKPLGCPQCGRAFRRPDQLRAHQAGAHRGPPPRPYRCPQCGRGFRHPSGLRAHGPVHSGGAAPFACADCGRAFWSPGGLYAHRLGHAEGGAAALTCAECGLAFRWPSRLRRHQLAHTGERPHVCGRCGRAFSRAGNLRTHQRVHTGERPFVCGRCGRGFSQLSNLKTHQLLHTGERPFACGRCGRSFSWSSSLRNHQCVHPDPASLG